MNVDYKLEEVFKKASPEQKAAIVGEFDARMEHVPPRFVELVRQQPIAHHRRFIACNARIDALAIQGLNLLGLAWQVRETALRIACANEMGRHRELKLRVGSLSPEKDPAESKRRANDLHQQLEAIDQATGTLSSEFAALDEQLTTKYEEMAAEAQELNVPTLLTHYDGAIEHARQMPYEAACELPGDAPRDAG